MNGTITASPPHRRTACASGKTYTGLKPGLHTFRVRAIDPAGNRDPTAAVDTWRVNA